MARRRGGIAGFFDRNKSWLKPAAGVAGFLAGGPAGSAAVNGLWSGFDREGRRGVGFDVRRGVRGAATGAAAGVAGNALTGAGGQGLAGLQRMFSQSGLRELGQNADFYGRGAINMATRPVRGVARWAAADPANLLALGQAAAGGVNAYGQAQENAALNRSMDMREDEFSERQRIRAMLMPYFQQYLARAGGGQ